MGEVVHVLVIVAQVGQVAIMLRRRHLVRVVMRNGLLIQLEQIAETLHCSLADAHFIATPIWADSVDT